MRMMQVPVYQVVDVVAVRHRFVPAARAMLVARLVGPTRMIGRAVCRVLAANRETVLIYVVGVRMMEMGAGETLVSMARLAEDDSGAGDA